MAFPATTTHELMLHLTLNFLTQAVKRSASSLSFFADETVLADAAATASLSFGPGLFEALQASAPPNISFFKGLESAENHQKRWAVYVLVLEKEGKVPCIYIGSGTALRSGVRDRFNTYRLGLRSSNARALPQFVYAALKDGMEITHMGLLVTAECPSPTNAPTCRLLFLALEATLSFGFWAMQSVNKDYTMGACFYWDRGALTYRGLCGHNAFTEGSKASLEMSPEQLEAVAAHAKAVIKARNKENYWRAKAEDPEGRKRDRRESAKRVYARSPDRIRARQERSRKKAVESGRFDCVTCHQAFQDQSLLEKHKRGKMHNLAVHNIATNAKATAKYYCDVCNLVLPKPSDLEEHNAGIRHLKKVAYIERHTAGHVDSDSLSQAPDSDLDETFDDDGDDLDQYVYGNLSDALSKVRYDDDAGNEVFDALPDLPIDPLAAIPRQLRYHDAAGASSDNLPDLPSDPLAFIFHQDLDHAQACENPKGVPNPFDSEPTSYA